MYYVNVEVMRQFFIQQIFVHWDFSAEVWKNLSEEHLCESVISPYSCLLGKFLFFLGGGLFLVFIVLMIIFILIIVIDLFQRNNLRSSLHGDALKKYCLYIRKTPRKTNVLSLIFFRKGFEIFSIAHAW